MRKVFLSFLGRGSYDEKTKKFRYLETRYRLNGKLSDKTEYVQVAELYLLGKSFDQIFIVATEQSHQDHYASLKEQASDYGKHFREILIEESMDAEGQWAWFEKIFSAIEDGDWLTVDLTHGYRSVPIVFSTALNFLQKTKNIQIEHVLYGAFEIDRNEPPIVDMRSFFDINLWADAVTRLTEEADARKISKAAEATPSSQFPELHETKLISAFRDVTERIRNVDVNNIAQSAQYVTELIQRSTNQASPGGKVLLHFAENKFSPLALADNEKKSYGNIYFANQAEFIKTLVGHELYMQAFTAMREFLVSIGERHAKKQIEILLQGEWKDIKGDKKKKRRANSRDFADKLIGAFAIEGEWNFSDRYDEGGKKCLAVMEPFFNNTEHVVLIEKMKKLCKELKAYRNGFDHAWTRQDGMKADIQEKADQFLRQILELQPLIERV